MALSAPRVLFGVHSISPYSRSDRLPYGILKVIGSANIALNSSVDQLYGGSQRFPWAAESKTISSEVSCKVKAYPGFLFTLWLGGTVVDNAAEALASVTSIANFKGTSAVAATGMVNPVVKTGSEASVKFGNYVVKVVGATTVDVYFYSDVDIARAVAGSYQNDALKITPNPLTIGTGASVDIPNFGLQLVGGGGTIGMTIGDTATFKSRPENTGSSDISIGAASTNMPAFGSVILAQKRATAEMCEIEAYNCIGYGMPLPMDEMAFSITELKMVCLYDSVQDKVFNIRTVIPNTFI